MEERYVGDDWVQSGGDWISEIELWRFYQSGQFVQHLSLPEDRTSPWDEDERRRVGTVVEEPRTLNFFDALYTVTEILMFAGGLAYRDVFESSASLRIELHRMKGRRLVAPRSPRFRDEFVSGVDTICWRQTVPSLAVLATAPELALDAATHIFTQFGWGKHSRKLVEEEQRRLLERRL
jgi:hypothetical protein